jgi:hypothetical protein
MENNQLDSPESSAAAHKPRRDQQETGSFDLVWGILAGVATAVAFSLGGFALIHDNTNSMGSVLFLLLPFVSGFATGLVARRWNLVIASLIIGFTICSIILLMTKMEGWVCVLMSVPLIAVGLSVGGILGVVVRVYVIDKSRRPRVLGVLMLFVLPLFLMGADSVEQPARRTPRVETFTSVLVVDATPEMVWNNLKTMDRVNGHKGLLMKIGLPVPVSCSIDREEVGGKRRCNFESGFIEERITEWDPPHVMKLEITAWNVPGRPWLDFRDASYELHVENGQTVMTRTTTIVSRLLPAWYWRRFERIGVETEHQYLFEAVRNRVDRK